MEFTAGTCSIPFIHGAGCVARCSARHPLSSAHCRVSSPGQVRHPSKLLCYAIVCDLCTVCILPACTLQRTEKFTALPCHAFAQVPCNVWDDLIPCEALYTSIYPHICAFLKKKKKVKNQQPTQCMPYRSEESWSFAHSAGLRRTVKIRGILHFGSPRCGETLPFIQELVSLQDAHGICAYL